MWVQKGVDKFTRSEFFLNDSKLSIGNFDGPLFIDSDNSEVNVENCNIDFLDFTCKNRSKVNISITNFRSFSEDEIGMNIVKILDDSEVNIRINEDLKNFVKVCDVEDLVSKEFTYEDILEMGSRELYLKCIDKFAQVQKEKFVGGDYPFFCVVKEKSGKLGLEYSPNSTTNFREIMNKKFEVIRQSQGSGRKTVRKN